MGSASTTARRPDGAFLRAHPAHFIALGLGTGLAPSAPGTFGTLLALPLHAALARWFDPLTILVAAALLFAIGIWASERTGQALGATDHGAINIDEVAAFLAVLACTPAGLGWQLLAFGLFRLFDIVKPPPIRWFERTVAGGIGVMLDDVLAAGYTVLVLAIVHGATR